jgi:hypothetical protein
VNQVEELSEQLNAELSKPAPRKPVEPLPIGLHANVPTARYYARRLGQVSKSGLDRFHRSPAHYKAWIEGKLDSETVALSFGRAFHCAILEPERFADEYAAEPDFGDCRFKAAKDKRNAWRDEHAGHNIVDSESMVAIEGMRAAVLAHPLAGKMIRDGQSELTAVWDDPDTGLRCQCRADYYVRKLAMILDVKTTDDAGEDGFRRSIYKYRYHVQDALYRFGFSAVGEHVQHFVLVAVEKEPPYALATYALDADGIGRGYSAARRDIDALSECIKTNKWPGYPERIQTIELPPWAE